MALVTSRSQCTASFGGSEFVPFPTTVLIADDDPAVRRLLRIAFEFADRLAAFECGVDDYLSRSPSRSWARRAGPAWSAVS